MHVCCCCRMQRGPRSSQSQPTFLSNFSLSLFNFRGRLLPLRAHDDRRQNLITEIALTGKPSVIWHGVWLCRRPAYMASKPAFNTAAPPERGRGGGNYTSDSERLNARRLGTFSIQLAMVPAKVARWQNLIPSFPCARVEGVGRNPRKGKDQILQRSVEEP